MVIQYGRVVQIEIGNDVNAPFLTIPPNTLASRLTAERTLDPEPDSATLVIRNLTRDLRKKLEAPDLVATYRFAYGETPLGTVFRGTTRRTRSRREGADWTTTLELLDGDFAYRDGAARMIESYAPGVTTFNVIRNAAHSFLSVEGAAERGFSIAANFDTVLMQATALAADEYGQELAAAWSKKFPRGLSLFGPSREYMTYLCDKHGLAWFFANHVVTLTPIAGEIGAPVVALTPNNGLIGTPEKLEFGFIQFDCLIRPEIVLGCKVWIKDIGDVTLEGSFRVERMNVSCDTHGQESMMTITGEHLST